MGLYKIERCLGSPQSPQKRANVWVWGLGLGVKVWGGYGQDPVLGTIPLHMSLRYFSSSSGGMID